MGNPLLCTLIGFPIPPGAETAAVLSRTAERLLGRWRAHAPGRRDDGHGDVEDFWEMAARLDAALSSGADRVWLHWAGQPVAHLAGTPTVLPVGVLHEQVASGEVAHYGPLTRTSPLHLLVDRRADQYAATQVFARHAGRQVTVCGHGLVEHGRAGVEATEVMAALAAEGHESVVVKAMAAKHGVWKVPTSTDPAVNEESLRRVLGWGLVHLEGAPEAVTVQTVVEMRYEYRVFVVDGVPVTGAGCLEDRTPLDADPAGDGFDPCVREHRAVALDSDFDPFALDDSPAADRVGAVPAEAVAPSGVESLPGLVSRYRKFVAQVAAEAITEGCLPRAYVVDCALVDEVPVIVEMNGFENAGLYASVPVRVTRALLGQR